MITCHIFNPETDYALGSPCANYSPPASILRRRKENALFPASYARKGDVIIVLDAFSKAELTASPYFPIVQEKGLRIVSTTNDLELFFNTLSPPPSRQVEIMPWGWNLSLRNLLIRKGVPEILLKSEDNIEWIRQLSHRKTSICFQKEISRLMPRLDVKVANEFFNEKDALDFAKENPGAFFKMPWSSAGRGVVCAHNLTDLKFKEWIHGAIVRQGSVMGEFGYDRTLDFATEWICANGYVRFMGLSLFDTSSNGTYLGNRYLTQSVIDSRIKSCSSLWSPEIIEVQKEIIEKLIAPHYDGPLGIDMLTDKEGNLNPCVEINVRMTMGMATILSNNN